MSKQKTIKVTQLFDTYGELYQPYIPPVMEALKKVTGLNVNVEAFKGIGNDVKKIPSYNKRRVLKRILALRQKCTVPLNYVEHKYLKASVDIVHIQHSYLHKKVKGLLQLPKNKRPKFVITLRGGDTYIKPWLNDNWKIFYNTYGKQVDAFIVMSAHQKNYLHEHWGIALPKIHVIPISFGAAQNNQPKEVDNNCIKIVSAFRMCWEKNIEGNLRVVKILKEKGYPVEYNIYGDGPDVGQVYYLIDKYNLSDCVHFHGRVSNLELKTHLLSSDFFLQLSHSEALPTSVIEAQSLGLPAIVSNSGGLPESIIPNVSGYCVDAYAVDEAVACIMKLWQSPEKYIEFSKKAIENSQSHFAVSKEVEKLNLLYCYLYGE